ncbi:MAG: gliding motility-associated C-terminal domain-containing protein [Bacteroidetes bacterium]|nr:gliding motility-associated C-terminal domain-containing protein [Bacteroidota bacterium]
MSVNWPRPWVSIFVYVFVLQAINAQGQCGSFIVSATDTQICLNQVVTFKATNIPALSQYTWYLGLDTIKGTDKDTVSVAYYKLGTFGIRLLIKLKNGDTCSVVKPGFIKVGQAPPIPKVTANFTSLCDVNQSVKLSTNAAGMAKYVWNVGQILYKDSTTTITHKFIRNGFFDVALKVENAYGCATTVVYDSLILVERKPAIDLGIGSASFCDTHTLFLSPGYHMFNQKGFNFSWTLSGSHMGSSSSKVPGKLFYANRGVYTFGLDVVSTGNCTYSYLFPDTLFIGKSSKLAHTKSTSAPCNEQTFKIDLNQPGELINPPTWKFVGDSVKVTKGANSAKATYKKLGNYKYTISHDDMGCVSEVTGTNTVTLRNLNAQFVLSADCSCRPQDTFFVTNTTKGATPSTSYLWRVTDASDNLIFSDNSLQPKLIINGYGTYNVELRAVDTSGCHDSLYEEAAIKISPATPGIAAEPKVACVGQDIEFRVDSICQDGFVSAQWNFYAPGNKLVATSYDRFPILSFADKGFYKATLTYTTAKCTTTITRHKVFEVVGLKSINFTLSDTTPCEGAVINAALKVDPPTIAPRVNWTITHVSKPGIVFNATAVQAQPNEFLLKPNTTGIFNMKLVVNGGSGCKDSIELPSFVSVSGVKFGFNADEVVGCLPFKTTLRATITKNEHYKNPSNNALTYEWQVQPNNTATIKDPTGAKTGIDIAKVGNYNVFLKVTNSDGCSDGVLKEDLFAFDFKAAFGLDTNVCQGIQVQPTNNTPGTNIAYRWYCNDTNAFFHTRRIIPQPKISFLKPGVYTLWMVATTKSGCKDSASKTIVVHPFDFDFMVLNNTPKCTPAQYEFKIARQNVDTFIWKFGDGKKVVTDQSGIAHVFDLSTVKPFRNEFDVALIGFNQLGCRDTISYADLIKVLGPNPTFGYKVSRGCDPMEVEFIDSTDQVVKFYFNYGDGSSVDSISFTRHTYSKRDTNRTFEVFKPFIIASDKNNCFVYYQPTDSIVVYANPITRFWLPSTRVCAPHAAVFANQSKFSVAYQWDYTNNGSIDHTTAQGKFTYKNGTYSVRLVAENKLGCTDTLTKVRYLTVFEKPTAVFNESDTILCPKRLIEFKDQTNAQAPIVSWLWRFTGNSLHDSAFGQHQLKAFKDTGYFSVSLEVLDANGCADTLIKVNKYHIVNRLPITSPILHYASVSENNAVALQWNRLEAKGFDELLVILNDDDDNPVRRITDYRAVNIVLPNADVVNAPQRYRLQLIDRCADPNRNTATHQTIHLSVTRNHKPFARLKWTKYQGWDNLDEYVVYRAAMGGDYEELIRTKPGDTAYVDYTVCNQKYSYLVGSVNPETGKVTYSNVVVFDPQYGRPNDTVEVSLATVVGDKILVTWKANDNLNVKDFFVDRYDEYNGWIERYRQTNDTFIIDQAVESNRLSYKYRVWYRDYCNNPNPASNEASTLLLLGWASNTDFVYSWNPYQEWSNGVAAYIIEKTFNLDMPFEEVAILGPEASTMIDNKKAIRSDSAFYVRVKAVEMGPDPDTSISNIIQVHPEPLIFLPNAFSPNGDNVNDLLHYDGIGIQKLSDEAFLFEVYNRWGEKVFESKSFNIRWDGSYQGKDCEMGNYTYYVRFRGVNGTTYVYTGDVVLFR